MKIAAMQNLFFAKFDNNDGSIDKSKLEVEFPDFYKAINKIHQKKPTKTFNIKQFGDICNDQKNETVLVQLFKLIDKEEVLDSEGKDEKAVFAGCGAQKLCYAEIEKFLRMTQ